MRVLKINRDIIILFVPLAVSADGRDFCSSRSPRDPRSGPGMTEMADQVGHDVERTGDESEGAGDDENRPSLPA